jgi:hypothetical protein
MILPSHFELHPIKEGKRRVIGNWYNYFAGAKATPE